MSRSLRIRLAPTALAIVIATGFPAAASAATGVEPAGTVAFASTAVAAVTPAPETHALSSSGLDASTLLAFWVGGGALALATAAVLVSVTVRQARKESRTAK